MKRLFLASLASFLALAASAETVEIRSAADWDNFAGRVNAGESTLGAVLMRDVTLTANSARCGTSETRYFAGEFDGNGKTLTVAFKVSPAPGVDDGAAPFPWVANGCNIHDLHVAGTLESDGKLAAGIIGRDALPPSGDGSVTVTRCRVSATITCTVAGDATSGGFIGCADQRTTTILFQDCVFDGSLLGPSANSSGGFCGWHTISTLKFANCLFDPVEVTIGDDDSYTIARRYYDSIDNTYYTRVFGTAQGTNVAGQPAEVIVSNLGSSNWRVVNEGGVGKAVPRFVRSRTDDDVSDPNSGVLAFAYQGALRDAQGNVLPERSHAIEFRLYDQAAGGSPHWGRRHAVRLDEEGNFAVELSDVAGEEIPGVPGTGLAEALARNSASAMYLGLAVDGGTAEISPRQKLLAVPAASFASDAAAASGDMAVDGQLSSNGARVAGTASAGSLATPGAILAGSATAMSGATVGGDLEVSGTITGSGTFPLGGIVPWHGPENMVPKGWAVCNGQTVNGKKTPNLSGRFIVGSGRGNYDKNATYYAIGSEGGEVRHKLVIDELPRHDHSFDALITGYAYYRNGNSEAVTFYGNGWNSGDKYISSEFTPEKDCVDHENRPPYFALLYIMRVE